MRRNVAYAVYYIFRRIGEHIHRLTARNARKHKYRVYLGFKSRDNVGVHSVSDDYRFTVMHVQQFYRVAHHQRVGLAYIIRILSACQFNGRDYRLCRGQNSVFARRGNVGICAYEFCSRQNKTAFHPQQHNRG